MSISREDPPFEHTQNRTQNQTQPQTQVQRTRRALVVGGVIAACSALLIAAAIVWIAPSDHGQVERQHRASTLTHGSTTSSLDQVPLTGSLVLPLTGTVQAGSLLSEDDFRGTLKGTVDGDGVAIGGGTSAASVHPSASDKVSMSVPAQSVGVSDGGATSTQSVDVPPGASQTLDRLSTHASSDGVIVSTFYAPGSAIDRTNTVSPPPVQITAPPRDSCTPTGEITLEISDTQAVATFTEPFYGGFNTPLVDVEIGELGVTEGKPATWVEAQVGPQATQVKVQFADGTTDSATPAKGVAVLAHVGDAQASLGDGSQAWLEVLGSGGAVLARFSIGVGTAEPETSLPLAFPAPGVTQPSNPGAARKAVIGDLATATSCTQPPVEQSQEVSDGGSYEELGGAGSSGLAPGDSITVNGIVFTSATKATVRYHLAVPSSQETQTMYAQASLTKGAWLVSLASVAPDVQEAPPNQDGDVAVAPGGPLFVHTGPGGVAIAVYKAQRSSSGDSEGGCDNGCAPYDPSASCIPTGGLVEEITTPGAVAIEAAPLYGTYTDPLIGVDLNIVGEAEGSPATVLGVEVGPSVSTVNFTADGATQSFTPADGSVETVIAGAPSTAIGPTGGSLAVLDSSGTTLSSLPIQVDATEPAPASTLPSTLPDPSSGTAPADPAAATAAIEQVFEQVFSCANAPIVRSGDIQDNGMFSNPLEQLYLGPYTSLVESVYSTVNHVVFVSPTFADVDYTIRFHNDPSLTFDMLGTAVVVGGSWRVSYATLCAAVQLGGVSCTS